MRCLSVAPPDIGAFLMVLSTGSPYANHRPSGEMVMPLMPSTPSTGVVFGSPIGLRYSRCVPSSETPPISRIRRVSVSTLSISCIAAAVLSLVAGWFLFRPAQVTPKPIAIPIVLPPGVVTRPGYGVADISKDGQLVMISGVSDDGTQRLYLRPIGEPNTTPVEGGRRHQRHHHLSGWTVVCVR